MNIIHRFLDLVESNRQREAIRQQEKRRNRLGLAGIAAVVIALKARNGR